MNRTLLSLLFVGAFSPAAFAQTPTFSKDVAPILQKACQNCHRPGAIAPMSLLTYQDARPWAKSIKAKVASREMPPWYIDRHVGVQQFLDDPSLTDAEIATIGKWVDAGAPQGNPADMPPTPKFTDGWQLGEPDYVVELPEVQIPATGGDYFPTPNLTLDLKEASVVTLYLLPDLNVKLMPQLEKLKPGSRIVSHDFDMKGAKPKQKVTLKAKNHMGIEGEHTVYLWVVPWEKE